jgi:CDP-glycerol glycerophosphotransferase
LTPGATDVVVDRIRRHHPDVIVVGYERSYADGRRFSDRLVAPGPALPEVFTAHEQPRILTTLTLACNKVIRREYLTGLGLRWGAGWYEDVAYTKPLLLAAERIGLIEAVCYGYRQRPEGATTSTTSQRHTEVFQQWQHVFDFADRPEYRDLRPVMFQRMIVHPGISTTPAGSRVRRRRACHRIVMTTGVGGGYPPGGVAT